ncbi:MAG TPA: ABC transporter permease [Alphaproteobacteria bacterium]|nr:ABC transporter permease [Alphaproteobacteria bacterium]
MKTIYIMWLREMKKFFRNKSRVVGALGQPLLFLLALGYGLGSVFKAAGQGNYIQFLAPGIIGMSIIFGSVFNGMSVIWDRQFGFLKETLVAPVPRFNIMFGRTLGGATTAALQGVVVLVITLFAGFQPHNWALVPAAILVMVLIGMLFGAIGLMFGSMLEDFQGFQLIMNFLIMPLFFLSGALFPLKGTPTVLQWIARFDPLAYGIDAMRMLLNNDSHFGLAIDLAVLIIVATVFVALSSRAFAKIQI